MYLKKICLCFFFFILNLSHAQSHALKHNRKALFLTNQNVFLASNYTEIESGLIFQNIDQTLKSSEKNKFAQRYWVQKPKNFSNKNPVLFYICGEAECGPADLELIRPWANSINAAIVAVEHRYYGQSQAYKHLSTKNLRFLNVEQALLDYKKLITYLKYSNNMKGPWIAVGGSYAGILSSSLRLYFPKLVVAAWASSAPLALKRLYSQYDENILKNIGPTCALKMQSIVQYAESILEQTEVLNDFKSKIGASNIIDKDDFLFSISDIASAAIQYGYKDFLCDRINQNDAVTGFIQFAKDFADTFSYTPESYSFSMAKETNASAPHSALRAFYYQQCTQIGLFQIASANLDYILRSKNINSNYIDSNCIKLFGPNIKDQSQQSLKNYFLPLMRGKGSEIYFSNGELDPFLSAGISRELGTWNNPNTYAHVIKNSYHCTDIFYDEAENIGAEIKLLLKKWALK